MELGARYYELYYLRCAAVGSRAFTSSFYRIWDYPGDNGYILMEEFTDMT
jgi:hypothetical protein